MQSERAVDPMDRFSKPVEVQDTKLGKLFCLDSRKNPDKPGRVFRVIFDNRFPLVDGFEPKYLYSVTFDDEGNQAGNHYHHEKSELFCALSGSFEVHLEDPDSKEHEIIDLNSDTHEIFFIKAGIAHKVISKSKNSVLLVVATAPNIDGDEFHYDL